MNNFKTYLEITDFVQTHGAILLPEDFSWAKEISKLLPALDLDLPKIQKKATISLIMDKKNPIYIQLSDGSKLFFSLGEFRKIQGKPALGKTMAYTLQRLSHDKSDLPSQITNCQII